MSVGLLAVLWGRIPGSSALLTLPPPSHLCLCTPSASLHSDMAWATALATCATSPAILLLSSRPATCLLPLLYCLTTHSCVWQEDGGVVVRCQCQPTVPLVLTYHAPAGSCSIFRGSWPAVLESCTFLTFIPLGADRHGYTYTACLPLPTSPPPPTTLHPPPPAPHCPHLPPFGLPHTPHHTTALPF